ncbi:hypothetical protein A2223_04720 [Candidatus Falkowbacteria bacterium RIFOXYA2_FULL_35_8]|nr:MAG: hypothetical protein A2223_04720 [Candidatus Falkowbacteria bacterium RIFOXYA2_FULL_35_8]
MYKYQHPKPIILKLTDDWGFDLRQKVAEYIMANRNTTGAERGTNEQQGFGALAQAVVRNKLEMSNFTPDDHPLSYDILLPSGIKVDVKCRGGSLPFQEEYESDDGIAREAKHNFFARQIHDENLDTDVYLLTHLETPKEDKLPGTKRQRKWILYICGWVSKERVYREGVYLPRGSLSERGRNWMQYRGQEIEFYNRNLNGLNDINDLLSIEPSNVEKDKTHKGALNLTSVDAVRIAYDLVGRGVLSKEHLAFVQKEVGLEKIVKPILHANQYFHLLKYLKEKGAITDNEIVKAHQILQEEPYSGI